MQRVRSDQCRSRGRAGLVFHREVGIHLDPSGELLTNSVDPPIDCGVQILAGNVVLGVQSEEPQPCLFPGWR